MIKPYFYKITNLVNGKFYYGSGSKALGKRYLGSSSLVIKSIKKYGIENFEFVILKEFNTREEAFLFEDRFLKFHKISENRNSYNLKDAGQGGWTTKNYSEEEFMEYRKKLSESQRGRIVTFETREKLREANSGKLMGDREKQRETLKNMWNDPNSIYNDPEYRKRLSESHKGRHVSEETKEKIRKSNLGGKNGMAVRIKVDNEIFETRRLCAEKYGISETAVTKRCKSKHFDNWEIVNEAYRLRKSK